MKISTLGLLLSFVSACAAKPTQEAAPAGKVTREAPGDVISMQADVEAGPPNAENVIVTNEAVLSCLVSGVPKDDPGFTTHVQARLPEGRPVGITVDGGSPALRGCLKGAVAQLRFEGGGKILKVHLGRAGALGLKGKPFDLPAARAPKKFE